jgi:hypothetical protein
MCPVMHKLGFNIPEDHSVYSHRRENLRSYVSSNIIVTLAQSNTNPRAIPRCVV